MAYVEPIDLTLEVSPHIPTFPGSPAPQFIQWDSVSRSGYNLELVLFSTHTGTHLDAPYHFAGGGRQVHQIPVGRLVRKAQILDLPGSGSLITREEIEGHERRWGAIGEGSTIVFRTGWSRFLDSPSYFSDNPGLAEDAAEYLASKGTNLVGIDSPSIDPGGAGGFPAHLILAGADVLILENLANLDRIRSRHFDLAVMPLRLRGTSGSPVRAVAL